MKRVTNIFICAILFTVGFVLYVLWGKSFVSLLYSVPVSATVKTVVEATSTVTVHSLVQKVTSVVPNTQDAGAPPIPKTKIAFVGDVMLARNVENIMHTYGSEYVFSNLTPVATSSFLVGNFESAIPKVHVHTPSMGFSFSVDPTLVGAAKKYGFTHFGIANNHSYDFGSEGYTNMQDVLTKNGLSYFGDQRNQASSTIAFIPIQGGTVAVVGIFAVDVAPATSEMQRLFARAKEHSDIQIAFIHFGTEYALRHSAYQEKIAHELVDTGFTMVIGHHPHVVEDIELYKNKFIFYSLGNFLFDQYFSEDVQKGLTLSLSIEPATLQIELLPVTSIGSRSAPRYMGGVEKEQFLEELATKSTVELSEMIKKGLLIGSK